MANQPLQPTSARFAASAAEWQSRYKDRQSGELKRSSNPVTPIAFWVNENVKPRQSRKPRSGEIAGWAYFGSIYNQPLQQTLARYAGSAAEWQSR